MKRMANRVSTGNFLFIGWLTVTAAFFLLGLAAAQNTNRQVDFKNFSYPWPNPSGWPHRLEWLDVSERAHVQLVDGRWRLQLEDAPPIYPFSGLTLESVEFADVTGTGRSDAIVTLRFDTGGTQYSHYVYIYSLAAEKPKLLAYFHSGDRSASGLYRVYAEGGQLVVELFDPDKQQGDCCSAGFIRTRYRWHAGRFEPTGARELGTPKATTRIPVTVFGTHE